MGCKSSFHPTSLGTINTNSLTAYRSSFLYNKYEEQNRSPPPYVYLAHPPFTQGCESLTFILKKPISILGKMLHKFKYSTKQLPRRLAKNSPVTASTILGVSPTILYFEVSLQNLLVN